MKRIGLVGSFVALAVGLAFAETGARQPGPCAQIAQACNAAGFVKGAARRGKGLYKNCVSPIVNGQSVQGVAVDPSTIQTCQQRRAARKAAKQREKSPTPAEKPAER